MKQPRTPREALTLALFLAITAPTGAQADQAAAMAEELAAGLTPADVAAAKRNALRRVRRHEAAHA